MEQGKVTEAISAFHEAADDAGQVDNKLIQGKALGNIGNALAQDGRHDEAIDAFERAESVFNTIPNKRLAGLVTRNMALSYANMFNYSEAIRCMQQFCASTSDSRRVADALDTMAQWNKQARENSNQTIPRSRSRAQSRAASGLLSDVPGSEYTPRHTKFLQYGFQHLYFQAVVARVERSIGTLQEVHDFIMARSTAEEKYAKALQSLESSQNSMLGSLLGTSKHKSALNDDGTIIASIAASKDAATKVCLST